jgi:nitroreductase
MIAAARSSPNEHAFVTAGRVCQRFWLTAAANGLASQPMAILPLFFAQHARFGDQGFPGQGGKTVERVQQRFKKAFHLSPDEHVMMVFRVGYAKPPSARSFRRPLGDLMVFSDDSAIAL